MKRIALILAAAVAFSTSAFAGDLCSDLEEMATVIMETRQTGVPMSEVMKAATRHFRKGSDRRMVQYLVMDAYSWPEVYSAEARIMQVIDFRNQVASICYEALRDAGRLR